MAPYRDPFHPTDDERQAARHRLQSSNRTRTSTGFTPVSSGVDPLQVRLAEFTVRRRALDALRAQEDAAREAQERAAFHGECFACRDTGSIRNADQSPCECPRGRAIVAEQHRRRLTAFWQSVAIPPRCQPYTLATYPVANSRALAMIREFLAKWDGRRGLILSGPYGTGKTGLLVGTLREVAAQFASTERRMQFVTTTDLMDALRDAIAATRQHRPQADGQYSAILDRAKRVSLLAIDDLGAEKPTAFVQERLFAILNHRYEHLLPTFATTNYGLEQLAGRITQRVVDRLLETCDVFAVEGPNLRQRQSTP